MRTRALDNMSINGDTYFYCNSLAVNEAYNGAAHACKLH